MSGKVGPVKPVNHTSLVAVVIPTDRPKSVGNRCVIELFCCAVCVDTLPFWHFYWCRGFCHRTVQISSFFSDVKNLSVVHSVRYWDHWLSLHGHMFSNSKEPRKSIIMSNIFRPNAMIRCLTKEKGCLLHASIRIRTFKTKSDNRMQGKRWCNEHSSIYMSAYTELSHESFQAIGSFTLSLGDLNLKRTVQYGIPLCGSTG